MKQFSITVYDHTDDEAINRRMAVRIEHLDGIKKLVESGNFISGGAILDKNGKMIGSSVHVQFPNLEEVENWVKNDPYTIGNVWDKLEILEVKLVNVENL